MGFFFKLRIYTATARNIAQGENIQVEEDHLRGVLEENGCPEAFVKMASKPHTAREPAEEPRATAFIPLRSRPK